MARQTLDLRRPRPSHSQKENFLVLHEEGVVGEYLAWIRRILEHQHATLRPIELAWSVQEAVEGAVAMSAYARTHGAPFTSVWCVFDARLHRIESPDLTFAASKRVRLVMCDPSVEQWFALHFSQLEIEAEPAADLQRFIPEYEGSLRDLENRLYRRYDDARARSIEWETSSTRLMNVYELIDAMRRSLQSNRATSELPIV